MNARAGIFLCAVAIASLAPATVSGQASESRLHELDRTKGAVLKGQGSVPALVEVVFKNPYDPDLASVAGLASDISTNESVYLSHPEDFPLSDLDVVVAFDAWRNLIADPNHAPTSPVDLHLYRMFLAGLAPSLISKDKEGLVSMHLSPVEAMYLFDFLIAHGTVPSSKPNAIKLDTRQYFASYDAYVDRVAEPQRRADLRRIVDTYLLKVRDSNEDTIDVQ